MTHDSLNSVPGHADEPDEEGDRIDDAVVTAITPLIILAEALPGMLEVATERALIALGRPASAPLDVDIRPHRTRVADAFGLYFDLLDEVESGVIRPAYPA